MRLCLWAVPQLLLLLATFECRAAEERVFALMPFDFTDSSGEKRDQIREHKERLALFHRTIESEFKALEIGALRRLQCQHVPCSLYQMGIESISKQALDQQARLLLVGHIKKMSTLVGQVKFAVIDLESNSPVCDRYITYRGDSDEAWERAGRFLAKDLAANCLKN